MNQKIKEEDERFTRGMKFLNKLERKDEPWSMSALHDIAPDLARFVVEFAYGDVHSRPGLSEQQRQLTKISALAALGYAGDELKLHIRCALNAGCTATEIIEVLIQIAVYAGFPAAINAMLVAKEVLPEGVHTPT